MSYAVQLAESGKSNLRITRAALSPAPPGFLSEAIMEILAKSVPVSHLKPLLFLMFYAGQYSGTFNLLLSGPFDPSPANGLPFGLVYVTVPVYFTFPNLGYPPWDDSGMACATLGSFPTACGEYADSGQKITFANDWFLVYGNNPEFDLPITLTANAFAQNQGDSDFDGNTYADASVTVDFAGITVSSWPGPDVTNQFSITVTGPPGLVLMPEPGSLALAAAGLLGLGVFFFHRFGARI